MEPADVLHRVGVVVVTHRSAATVAATLAALPHDRLADVVVVDNGSTDSTAAVVRETRVRLVEQANLGFGAGNNRGVRELAPSADLVLFLNPDAVLAARDLERLAGHLLDHPEVGVVGPRVWSGGVPSFSAGRLDTLATELRPLFPDPLSRLGPRRRLPPSYDVTGRVGYVEGACFLVRRSSLEQVGGFDEGYFLFFEELELARRLAAVGQQVHLVAQARVDHALGVSIGQTAFAGRPHLVTSGVRYLRRWHGDRTARTWVRALGASTALRVRLGRLDAQERATVLAAARAALAAPAPPPV